MELEELTRFKDNLRKYFLSMYSKKGYKYTVKTINIFIKKSTEKSKAVGQPELAIQIRGECCEILLELQILEFSKEFNLPWILTKGLVIPRYDGKKLKTTELDLTLFTPHTVVILESKFRKGKIKLIEDCTIVPDYGSTCDVYKQNSMHTKNLYANIMDALNPGKTQPPFLMWLYMSTNKNVKDLRTKEQKSKMPLVCDENITKYLNYLKSLTEEFWDIKKLYNIVKKLDSNSTELRKEHMEGVTKNGYKSSASKSK